MDNVVEYVGILRSSPLTTKLNEIKKFAIHVVLCLVHICIFIQLTVSVHTVSIQSVPW